MSQSGLNEAGPSKDGKAHPNVQISLSDKKIFANDDDDIEVSGEDEEARKSKLYIYNKASTVSMTLSDSFRFQSISRARSEDNLTRCQRFKLFLYNKQDESVCGRTAQSWLRIVSYFTLFIAGNVLLFMLLIYFLNMSDVTSAPFQSKSTLYSDAAPGFTFLPAHIDTTEACVIAYSTKEKTADKSLDKIIKVIDAFMAEQEKQCKRATKMKHICKFNRTSFGPCSKSDYGYKSKKPCVFIKLNNLDRWIPKHYSENKSIPKEIPKDLRKQMLNKGNKIWVRCFGSHKADEEMLGQIKYLPTQWYHQQYFPADRAAAFNPVVAIQLEQIQLGRIIQLQCKLYAANIKDDGNAEKELYIYIK